MKSLRFFIGCAIATIPVLAFSQLGAPITIASSEIPYLPPDESTDLSLVDNVDLDGDGQKDILTCGYIGERLGPIWYKNLGSGTYSAPHPIGQGIFSHTRNILAMDVNDDGQPDIVTTVQGSDSAGNWMNYGLGYFLNMGGGLFSSSPVLIDSVTTTSVSSNYRIQQADLDGDLRKDLVVALNTFNAGDRRLWWYRNNGNGFDTPLVLIQTGTPGITSIDLGDIDDDGDVDIAYCTSSIGAVAGYFMNTGNGTFDPQILLNNVASFTAIRIKDIDIDGDNDLICLGSNIIRIYINNGLLQFDNYTDINNIESDYKSPLSFMDINIDTYPDIILSSVDDNANTTYTFLNAGDGSVVFAPADTLPFGAASIMPVNASAVGHPEFISCGKGGLLSSQYDTSATVWTISQISNEVPNNPSCLVDWDGDGLTDILRATNWGAVIWYQNEGNLGFSRSKILGTKIGTLYGNDTRIMAKDMDNDGDLDLLIIGISNGNWGAFTILPNLGVNGWGTPLFSTSETSVNGIEVIDADNDGDLDLVYGSNTGMHYYKNNGSGVFTFVSGTSFPSLRGFQAIDLNGDGLMDMLCTDSYPQRLMWSQNLGSAGFGPATLIDQNPSTMVASYFILSDVDGDGNKDFVYGLDSIKWRKNMGAATFSPASLLYTHQLSWPRLYDINSDGLQDLVLIGASYISISINLGGAIFDPNIVPHASALFIDGGFSTGYYDDFCTDFDNDGDLEFIFSGLNSSMGRRFLTVSHNFSGTMVTGHAYVDENGNGVYDAAEAPAPYMDLALDPLGSQPLTDASGSYSIYADPGSYDLQCPGPWLPGLWALTAGAMGFQFPLVEGEVLDSLDFGLTPLVDSSLITPSLTIGTGSCGAQTPLWISFANDGTRIEHGEVQLALADGYGFISSEPTPISIVGNILTWSFDSLSYFTIGSIDAVVTLPSVDYIGDTLSSILTVSTFDGSNTTATFTVDNTEVQSCAFDPNDKSVLPKGYGVAHAVDQSQDHLDYTIRFQNTGTDTASTVIIRDQLSNSLDPDRLELLGYSHAPTSVQVDVEGWLEVQFLNIQLPDSGANYEASQGYFSFRIGVDVGLLNFTQVTNSAKIYFDLNEPVITDTTLTTLVDCDQWNPSITIADVNLLEASEGDTYQWFLNGFQLPADTSRLLVTNTTGAYAVQVTSQFGCMRLSDEVVLIALAINDPSATLFALAPNPFTTETRLLSSEVLSPNYRIKVIDIYGRVLQQQQGNGTKEARIQRDQLSQGIYLVRVSEGENIIGSARMVVQ